MFHDLRDAGRPSPRPLPPPSRRRDKPQLSCMSCRSRKYVCIYSPWTYQLKLFRLKCDRSQPCSNCSKRQQSCVYVAPGHGNRVLRGTQVRPDSSTGLQERIHRLEQIVEDLANANYYQSESCREDEQYSAYPQRMQALRHTRQLGMSILLHSEKLALLISRIPLVELISTKEEPAMLDLHIGKRSSTRYEQPQ